MKTKIGFVGNKELRPVLDSVSKEFKEVELTYYFYETEKEARDIVIHAQAIEDIILFGGPVPYHLVKDDPQLNIPMLHISYDGSAFYRGLLHVMFQLNLQIDRVSVDVISEQTVNAIYEDLHQPTSDVYIHPKVHIGTRYSEFHQSLYQSGKTNCAITCVRSTYETLKQQGIPAVLVLATESAIREGIQKAILENRSNYFRKSQIAVGYLQFFDKKEYSEYESQKIHLEHHQQLMLHARDLHADIFPLNRKEFVFYTTRGMLEKNDVGFVQKVLKGVKSIADHDLHIGLGFGSSAQTAGTRARTAIDFSKTMEGDQCFLTVDDHQIVNLLAKEENAYRTDDKQIQKIADDYQVSAMVIKRFYEAVTKLGKNKVTAEELSLELNQTPRNTRRTLKEFVEKGLANQIGEEHLGGKGRPKIVYELVMK